ncbi:MAG: glycosyltransferase [Mogibacterium sp.]|nr:glycosyltransferase [Mogibacterium sp.]MBR2539719.1 glycosyltransferase [Mogibacterium sp.]
MTKVLQISNYLYPNRGGIEQVARDIANALSEEEQISQKIICFNETAEDGDHICHRKETVTDSVDGVEVIRCGCITKKASQSISLTFGRELRKVLKEFDPDIVIFHYPNPFQAFYLLPYLKKDVRLVVYWHLDIVKQKVLGKLFHGQNLRLLKRADAVIATSPVYIDGSPYLSRFRSKCRVIPNCINEDRLVVNDAARACVDKIREDNQGKIVCFAIGRHIPYKGFTYLIKASKYLDDRFRIYIAGKGELTESLKEEASGDSKITFLGRIDDDELIAYYQAMDLFCFPSITKNEAFGIALAEGMYFGKPAVTFTIPGSGVNYVNKNNVTGLEVPNRDAEAYARAMTRLADDSKLRDRLGDAARERVNELFLGSQFKINIRKLIKDIQ